jgi:AAA family ATPase
MEVLLDKTEGFSGAEVVSICNEAAIFAIDEDAEFVTQAHLVKAAEELKPQITQKMLQFYKEIALKFIT